MVKSSWVLLLVSACLTFCSEQEADKCSGTIARCHADTGCGHSFELEDGTLLEPEFLVYPAVMIDGKPYGYWDPLYGFEWIEGKHVFITYDVSIRPPSCADRQLVRITGICNAGNDQGSDPE